MTDATSDTGTYGYPEELIEEGERIMESPITGEKYRVTKWVDKGEDKCIAIEKELLDSQ
jgi:hypothetical protein